MRCLVSILAILPLAALMAESPVDLPPRVERAGERFAAESEQALVAYESAIDRATAVYLDAIDDAIARQRRRGSTAAIYDGLSSGMSDREIIAGDVGLEIKALAELHRLRDGLTAPESLLVASLSEPAWEDLHGREYVVNGSDARGVNLIVPSQGGVHVRLIPNDEDRWSSAPAYGHCGWSGYDHVELGGHPAMCILLIDASGAIRALDREAPIPPGTYTAWANDDGYDDNTGAVRLKMVAEQISGDLEARPPGR